VQFEHLLIVEDLLIDDAYVLIASVARYDD